MNMNVITTDPDKLRVEQLHESTSFTSKTFGSLVALLIMALIVWSGMILSNPDTLPIKQVRIEGDFTRLSPVDLQLLVTDKVRGGFFSLNVEAVRLALMEEPWVSHATVKRVWPDALRVVVIEQVPVVRWKEKGLLNVKAEYFEPEVSSIPTGLPILSGPDGSENILLQTYHQMQEKVKKVGFNIASLTLDERRAWSFKLSQGINIILGRREFDKRFSRFLTLIPTSLSGRVNQTDAIDMRYTNGFSIRWKK